MRIARPWSLELEYTREMMLPLLLRTRGGWPKSVLQVGLGAASFTRFLHRHRPDARLTVVEIAPEVRRRRPPVLQAAGGIAAPAHRDRRCARLAGDDQAQVRPDPRRRLRRRGARRHARDGAVLPQLPQPPQRRRHAGGESAHAQPQRDAGHGSPARGVRGARRRPARLAARATPLRWPRRMASCGLRPAELHEAARRWKAESGLDLSPTLERLHESGGRVAPRHRV